MIACSLDGGIICCLLHFPLKNMTFCTGNTSVIQQHYKVPLWITLKRICEWKEQKLWLLQKPPQTGCSVKKMSWLVLTRAPEVLSMISSLVLRDWTLSGTFPSPTRKSASGWSLVPSPLAVTLLLLPEEYDCGQQQSMLGLYRMIAWWIFCGLSCFKYNRSVKPPAPQ